MTWLVFFTFRAAGRLSQRHTNAESQHYRADAFSSVRIDWRWHCAIRSGVVRHHHVEVSDNSVARVLFRCACGHCLAPPKRSIWVREHIPMDFDVFCVFCVLFSVLVWLLFTVFVFTIRSFLVVVCRFCQHSFFHVFVFSLCGLGSADMWLGGRVCAKMFCICIWSRVVSLSSLMSCGIGCFQLTVAEKTLYCLVFSEAFVIAHAVTFCDIVFLTFFWRTSVPAVLVFHVLQFRECYFLGHAIRCYVQKCIIDVCVNVVVPHIKRSQASLREVWYVDDHDIPALTLTAAETQM